MDIQYPCEILIVLVIFKEIYCTESIYSVYKDKLQNCFCNQFEYKFTLWYKWN
jgi:hypothetical protein